MFRVCDMLGLRTMDHRLHLRFLLKLIACIYVLGFASLLITLHELRKGQIRTIGNNTITKVKNVTHYVYVNHSVLVYTERLSERHGPGQNGANVEFKKELLSNQTLNKTAVNQKNHGFNTFISDAIGEHRRAPDLRSPVCKDKVYPSGMPAVSVVVIFRDEWPSIVLRTAYGVLETSPPELLREVILVDDGSVDDNLIAQVAIHVHAVDKFKLIRNKNSKGLMMARQAGIEAATAEYFVVLDGHMEVCPGWLEPLVYRLVQQPNALLCSHVGAIASESFQIFANDNLLDHFFPFYDPLTLDQQWVAYRDSYKTQRNHSVEPIEYGTIQGMMTVMRKDFFMQLGGFDPGMKIWGTEQMELSIKVWLCGGVVEMVPCSKVAHMYRITPWGGFNATSDHGSTNKRRTIDVWFDQESREFVMDYIKHRKYDIGSLEDRHRIRIENHCKPFKYFVEKVNEISDVFFPRSYKAKGAIYNAELDRCVDLAQLPNKTGEYKILLYPCHGNVNQFFYLTENSQIRTVPQLIFTVDMGTLSIQVTKNPLNVYEKETYWDYRSDNSLLHRASRKCLTAVASDTIGLKDCRESQRQVWTWRTKFEKSQS